MEINLSGQRALVTGAAQGIGLAVVEKLVACGAKVVALDVKEEKLKELATKLPGVETLVVDLSDWSQTLESLKTIGQVQLVVNNAGVDYKSSCQNVEENGVDWVLDINLKGVMAVCKHVVRNLTSAGLSGAIVNILSVLASKPYTIKPAYCASKAALLQYTRCLALECAPKGIRVNGVSPGLVNTELARADIADPEIFAELVKMTPMTNPITEPEDVANAVAFLLCDKVSGRITGSNLHVDGGFMLS